MSQLNLLATFFRLVFLHLHLVNQILLPISIKSPESLSKSAKGFNEIIIYIIRFNCFAIINYYFSATILVATF